MPRSDFSSDHQTTASSRVRGVVLLVDAEFQSGTIYVTSHSIPVVANGHTYTALGDLISVGEVRESENLTKDKLKLNLAITNLAMLAYAIGPASAYRGRNIRLYGQLINDKHQPVWTPFLMFSGVMENFEINRSPSDTGRLKGTIELNCQRKGLERFRNVEGLRASHAQQQIEYPGDRGFEYTEELVKHPPVWLTRAFQEI